MNIELYKGRRGILYKYGELQVSEKLLDYNPNIKKYIPSPRKFYKIKKQLSKYPTTHFNCPFYGSAILYPDEKKADLHIQCYIESVTKTESLFDYFTLKDIVSALGISTFRAEPGAWSGTAIPYGIATGTGSISLMGRSGLCVNFTKTASNEFNLGRLYQTSDDTLAEGPWGMNTPNLIIAGRGYKIDILNLTYE